MDSKNYSTRYTKQRRFLLIFPLLTLPFITLMFWAFGGGKKNSDAIKLKESLGLNVKLPDAKLKDDKGLNKLSFYERAAVDSIKLLEAKKLDPYWKSANDIDQGTITSENRIVPDFGLNENKSKVYQKLEDLKKALNESSQQTGLKEKTDDYRNAVKAYAPALEEQRLKTIMQQMKENKTEDPELTQLNNMLDKILAIQHPEEQKPDQGTFSKKTLSVKKKKKDVGVSLLKNDESNSEEKDTLNRYEMGNAFYSTETDFNNDDSIMNNAIEAIIPETQTIVAGSTIKLIITNDARIGNTTLPAGTLMYGMTSLANERLKITIKSIRFANSILPVSLNVYDMDGQEGIYIPGSINRTVTKESANNAIGGINTTTLNPSIGAQAEIAGIEAAKTLFSKKIKLVKMTIKAGYKVLLKDNHDK
jgi:conjugative transposon TraM protein